jgi:hypothetical protein
VGRAIRKDRTDKTGIIIIPVFIQEGEDAEVALSSSRFEPIWAVLQALREHDDILADELDVLRYTIGRRGGINGTWPEKLVIDLPVSVGDEFVRSLKTRIVETTAASWHFWYGLLATYKEENGHVNVPTKTVFHGYRLASWVNIQRRAYKNGKLSTERIRLLEELGFIWDALETAWNKGYQQLVAYKEENGHVNVPGDTVLHGYTLGNWVTVQRDFYRRGRLSTERIRLLEELGFIWDALETAWNKGYQHLRAYKEENGHVNVPQVTVFHGYTLGSWVAFQRAFYKRGKLSAERILILEELGFNWGESRSS